MKLSRPSMSRYAVWTALFGVMALGVGAVSQAQIRYDSGQTIAAVFEGWERNPDGSFNMVFGYMNRNYEETLDIPVGPNNMVEPGGADQGQPTHFFPRRQQFVFKVKVPGDWGKKDLVWTLTHRGHTEKAYGTLTPFWEIDNSVYHQNRSGPGAQGSDNTGPALRLLGGARRSIAVGQELPLEVEVTDDGLPAARASRGGGAGRGGAAAGSAEGERGRGSAMPPSVTPERQNPITQMVVRLEPGMRLGAIWVMHRRSGAGTVTFNPAKAAVENGRAKATATFSAPGTYTLRVYADDGILLDYADVTVTVTDARAR